MEQLIDDDHLKEPLHVRLLCRLKSPLQQTSGKTRCRTTCFPVEVLAAKTLRTLYLHKGPPNQCAYEHIFFIYFFFKVFLFCFFAETLKASAFTTDFQY